MSRVKNVNSVIELGFRVHTANLLDDIVINALTERSGVLAFPLNNFKRWLVDLTERCAEINDPELNIIMLSMGLYDVDPKDIVGQIENQIELMQNKK